MWFFESTTKIEDYAEIMYKVGNQRIENLPQQDQFF